ncbi:hypothetical protein GFY24_08175 [Nocardia sp. SYP-A9097]|nr:hypothetical protein [Nocardia sp. SYP-A9097]MRH87435.1 hypothetical protein [Nocardia sp. SYP-A9097]
MTSAALDRLQSSPLYPLVTDHVAGLLALLAPVISAAATPAVGCWVYTSR